MTNAFELLAAQSFDSLLVLAWFFVVFEAPRYVILFALTAVAPRRKALMDAPVPDVSVSAVVVGHSEGAKLRACVGSLHEQSRPPDEIIVVSDGSTDDMRRHVAELSRAGLIDAGHATDLRSGKAAGLNFGASQSSGEIILFIDCDSSLDRHAVRNLLRRFADPKVGAVAGNVLVRNHKASLWTSLQAVEYLMTISLGKLAMDRLGLVSCVSGAFGGFRRSAFDAIGGHDAECGEDLDISLSIRSAGHAVTFAEDAVCLTSAPTTLAALIRQRTRWERDAIRLRLRKHSRLAAPFSPQFRWREWLHEIEFLVFNVAAAVALPFYVLWILIEFGDFGLTVLLAAQILLSVVDLVIFFLALSVVAGPKPVSLIPFAPGFSIYYGFFMRMVRLQAYLSEWMFRASTHDQFVPAKVRTARQEYP